MNNCGPAGGSRISLGCQGRCIRGRRVGQLVSHRWQRGRGVSLSRLEDICRHLRTAGCEQDHQHQDNYKERCKSRGFGRCTEEGYFANSSEPSNSRIAFVRVREGFLGARVVVFARTDDRDRHARNLLAEGCWHLLQKPNPDAPARRHGKCHPSKGVHLGTFGEEPWWIRFL